MRNSGGQWTKKRKGCLREKKQNKTKQEKSGGEHTVTGGGALRSRGEEEEEESGRDKLMELKAARKRQTYTSQRERQKRSQEERVERN